MSCLHRLLALKAFGRRPNESPSLGISTATTKKNKRVKRLRYPDDLQDFAFADGSVPVHVVQGEGPLQLLQGFAPGREVQSHNVLLEVQRAVGVGVEAAEHVARVLRGVGVGEEAGVDALELLLADLPAGTLLQEGLVPGAQLGLGVLGVGLELLQELLGQRAALGVPHAADFFFFFFVSSHCLVDRLPTAPQGAK